MEKRRTKKEIVKMLLRNNELDAKDEEELLDLLIDQPIAIDVDKQEEAKMTTGDRVADKVSEVAGSWTFIIIFILFLVGWIILNTVVLTGEKAVDPYPFILLNLLLSCIAAIQAPIIMMSQNRQAEKDSLRNQNDYRTDLKSELILESLHDHMELIIKNQKKILKQLEKGEESDEKSRFIIIIMVGLLLTGCGTKEKSSLNNSKIVDDSSSSDTDSSSSFDTKGSGKLKCTRKATGGTGVDVSLNYEIKYKNGNIQVLHSVEEITSDSSEKLDEYQNAYEKIAANYEDLKYYDTNVIRKNNKVINDTTINYAKLDMDKLLEIEGEEDNVVENGKVKLETWLDFAKRFGTTCEEIK